MKFIINSQVLSRQLQLLSGVLTNNNTVPIINCFHFHLDEGMLTVRRTHLVSGAALADAAERLGLRDYLKFNQGAQPPPPHAKVLADSLEALRGAVWLDGGLPAAGFRNITNGL